MRGWQSHRAKYAKSSNHHSQRNPRRRLCVLYVLCVCFLSLCWRWTGFDVFQVYKTPNGVTCIGYTDMTSRLANTASTLFSNNIFKLFASAGPFSTG